MHRLLDGTLILMLSQNLTGSSFKLFISVSNLVCMDPANIVNIPVYKENIETNLLTICTTINKKKTNKTKQTNKEQKSPKHLPLLIYISFPKPSICYLYTQCPCKVHVPVFVENMVNLALKWTYTSTFIRKISTFIRKILNYSPLLIPSVPSTKLSFIV